MTALKNKSTFSTTILPFFNILFCYIWLIREISDQKLRKQKIKKSFNKIRKLFKQVAWCIANNQYLWRLKLSRVNNAQEKKKWKRRFHAERQLNVFLPRYAEEVWQTEKHQSRWSSVWGNQTQLGEYVCMELRVIITMSSFSKAPFSKGLPSTLKLAQGLRFHIPPVWRASLKSSFSWEISVAPGVGLKLRLKVLQRSVDEGLNKQSQKEMLWKFVDILVNMDGSHVNMPQSKYFQMSLATSFKIQIYWEKFEVP